MSLKNTSGELVLMKPYLMSTGVPTLEFVLHIRNLQVNLEEKFYLQPDLLMIKTFVDSYKSLMKSHPFL